MNSFKKLYNNKLTKADGFEKCQARVKRNLDESRKYIHFTGDMLELFVPRVVDYMVHSLGDQAPIEQKPDDKK